MIKLLKKLFCIIGISIAIIVLLNLVIPSHADSDRLATYDNLDIEDMPQTIKYVNFGSSHGQRSFKYSSVGDKIYRESFNFGTSAQSLNYDYLWASQYADRFNADEGVAFITVSYFTLYQDELLNADFQKKNLRYYPYLDREHMRNWNLKDAVFYGKIYYNFPILQLIDKQIGSIFYFNEEWLPKEEQAEKATLDKTKAPTLVENNLTALKNLIELFKQHKYRIIIVTTPVQEDFRKDYSDGYLNKFYSDMNDIAETYDIEYWNCEHLFDDRPDLFIDLHHLSEAGAEEFTKIVFEKSINLQG